MKNIYCVEDKATGKLVANLVSPRKRYWQVKGFRDRAIKNAKKWGDKRELVPLDYVLITQKEYDDLKEKAWRYDELCK